MTLVSLTSDNIRQIIADAIITGVSRDVTKAWELAARYGYDVTGRWGAVANRFMIEGQKINDEAGYDVIGINFPGLAARASYVR